MTVGGNIFYSSLSQDLKIEDASDKPEFAKPHRKSWKTTVSAGAAATAVVFLVNIIVLAWSLISFQKRGNFVTIFEGSCDRTRTISTWSHLIINILSTVLLAASNSCAQILGSPTRAEVDKAHAKGRWVDIGVGSVANVLGSIGKRRTTLFLLLILSSLPLHLLFNSVIYSTIAASGYKAVVVTENFIHGGWWHGQTRYPAVQDLQDNIQQLVRLDNADCIKTYGKYYQSGWGDVLVVTSLERNDSFIEVLGISPADSDSGSWMCNPASTLKCDYHSLSSHSTEWTIPSLFQCETCPIVDAPIQYCLARRTKAGCTIEINAVFLAVVIVCNGVKLICLFSTVRLRGFEPLVTVGDAISSFIQAPDTATTRSGLTTGQFRADFKCEKRRWLFGINVMRALTCSLLCIAFWCVGLGLLLYDNFRSNGRIPSWSKLWALAFGPPNLNWAIGQAPAEIGWFTRTECVLVANSPQLAASVVYIYANKMLTSMVSAHEYTNFAAMRKSLRVSDPRGEQRSTFWLQLPYRYGLPFTAAMTVLHFFISRSLFVFALRWYEKQGRSLDVVVTAIGYSQLWLIFSLMLGAIIFLALVALSFQKLQPGIAIATGGYSNSLALSAAAHPASEEDDAAFLPLKYGIVRGKEGSECIERVGFSSKEVDPLIIGATYSQGG